MPQNNPNKVRILQWIETRWPLSAIVRWSTVEEIPGGPRFAYVLGSATLFLFVLQAITGVWEMLYYVPTVDHAYQSVMYLRLQVRMGWLIHGLHYWGANAFLVVMGVHAVRVFIWAAYKKPRELVWVAGVVLLLLAAAFIFTGAILPWDTLGYWAGEVGTSMAATVPFVGNFMELLIRGGVSMGQMTLSRAFFVHIAVLPVLTIIFIAVHLVAFRQFGSVGPWNPARRKKNGWFWPDQVYLDLLMICLITLALIYLCVYIPAPITGPADPLDSSYTPKPEWNFIFLYEALKVFKGPLERIGVAGLPLVLILLLFSAPFIDRKEERDPLKRPVAMLIGLIFVVGILALTLIGLFQKPEGPALPAPGPKTHALKPGGFSLVPSLYAEPAPEPSSFSTRLLFAAASPNAGASPVPIADTAGAAASPAKSTKRGELLFSTARCISCHMIGGLGNKSIGPDLSSEVKLQRSRDWLLEQIQTPTKHNPRTVMPSTKWLTSAEYDALVDFLLRPSPALARAPAATTKQAIEWEARLFPGRKKNPIASDAMSIESGRMVFKGECFSCHGPLGKGNGPASLALPVKVADLTAPIMGSFSDGALFEIISQGRGAMPAFDGLLTDTLRWNEINYLRTLAPKLASPTTPKAIAPLSAIAPAAPTPSPARAIRAPAHAARAFTGLPANLKEGATLFTTSNCIKCHMIRGVGGNVGPKLDYEARLGHSPQWIKARVHDPASFNPKTLMPAVGYLTEKELNTLVDFILNPLTTEAAVKVPGRPAAAAPVSSVITNPQPSVAPPSQGAAVVMVGDGGHGKILYDGSCQSCHGKNAKGGLANPGSTAGKVPPLVPIALRLFNRDPLLFAENIDRFVQLGSIPAGPAPMLRMPAFGATRALTQEQLANIEAYVLMSNGVDRAKILEAGILPRTFAKWTTALFGLAFLLVGMAWIKNRKPGSADTTRYKDKP